MNYAADTDDPMNTQPWEAFRAKCDECGSIFRMSFDEADALESSGLSCLCPDCADDSGPVLTMADDEPLDV